ncbi:hypothetical protein TSOC_012747, partial [Tetrabaena socialis]
MSLAHTSFDSTAPISSSRPEQASEAQRAHVEGGGAVVLAQGLLDEQRRGDAAHPLEALQPNELLFRNEVEVELDDGTWAEVSRQAGALHELNADQRQRGLGGPGAVGEAEGAAGKRAPLRLQVGGGRQAKRSAAPKGSGLAHDAHGKAALEHLERGLLEQELRAVTAKVRLDPRVKEEALRSCNLAEIYGGAATRRRQAPGADGTGASGAAAAAAPDVSAAALAPGRPLLPYDYQRLVAHPLFLEAMHGVLQVRETDTRSLLELYGDLAYADLERESVYDVSEANLLKLVRVLQLFLQLQQHQLEQSQGAAQLLREEAVETVGVLRMLPHLDVQGVAEGLGRLQADFYKVADADMDAMFAQQQQQGTQAQPRPGPPTHISGGGHSERAADAAAAAVAAEALRGTASGSLAAVPPRELHIEELRSHPHEFTDSQPNTCGGSIVVAMDDTDNSAVALEWVARHVYHP